jgi:hypothetical protein
MIARAVQEAEVGDVGGVLHQLLRVGAHGPVDFAPVGVVVALERGQLPRRGAAVGVVPQKDQAAALARRPAAHADARQARRIGHLDAAAVGAEAPAVKRAAQRVTLDAAALAEVGAEVRAVGLERMDAAVGRAVDDQLFVEVVEWAHFAGGDFVRARHHEPTVREALEGKNRGAHWPYYSAAGRSMIALRRARSPVTIEGDLDYPKQRTVIP